MTASLAPEVTKIHLSDEEGITGVSNSLTIETALAALQRDGKSTVLFVLISRDCGSHKCGIIQDSVE
jgi:hypothetical protein